MRIGTCVLQRGEGLYGHDVLYPFSPACFPLKATSMHTGSCCPSCATGALDGVRKVAGADAAYPVVRNEPMRA